MAKIYGFFQRPGVKISLLVVALFAAVVVALAVLLSLATGWSFGRAFDASFTGLVFGSLLINLGQMIVLRPRAGPVLLDAGPSPQRVLYLFLTLSYLVFSIDWNFQYPILSLRPEADSLLISIFFITLASGRLQVCERGVWLYTALLPWRKINSYMFYTGTLYFRTNGLWCWTNLSCTVPEAHIKAFEAYLLEHAIPDSTATAAAST